ncbi:MAG: methyltransferase domain-containing protein [Candidatus Riflebacteria bacterium]|nr:methyltransferase domain-containing protein [Candidatus Riflebacteria bacterium]
MYISRMRKKDVNCDFYSENFLRYHQNSFNADPSVFLDPLLKHISPPALILDVGCGSGRDLLWLKNKGFDTIGFERSVELAELAAENSGSRVVKGDFFSYDFSVFKADAILLIGAMVHVPHEDFEAALKNILNAAGKNTLILLSLKKGDGTRISADGRTFFLWNEYMLNEIFLRSGLIILSSFENQSVLNTAETWLGYVLKRSIL